jgi:hypothetical protein
MIPKKLAPHLMRGGYRFSDKIMRHEFTDGSWLISVIDSIELVLNLFSSLDATVG